MVAYEELFRKVGLAGGADPYFVPLLPSILDLFQESGKTSSIKDAAEKAAKQLVRLSPPELAPKVIEELFSVIEGGAKWRSKVGALELLQTFATSAKDQVAERLGEYVPRLSGAMRDTKAEVRTFSPPFRSVHRLSFPVLITDLFDRREDWYRSLPCPHQPRHPALRARPRQVHGRPYHRPRRHQASLLHRLGSRG